MSQGEIFPELARVQVEDSIYAKTTARHLIYEPSLQRPHIEHLVDRNQTLALEAHIKAANIGEKEKQFLLLAAQRHNGFNFDRIAYYYAHASIEMQSLMEESGLVIIDFNKAIELGYVGLSENIAAQFKQEYGEEPTDA